jgi:hypothetical protein
MTSIVFLRDFFDEVNRVQPGVVKKDRVYEQNLTDKTSGKICLVHKQMTIDVSLGVVREMYEVTFSRNILGRTLMSDAKLTADGKTYGLGVLHADISKRQYDCYTFKTYVQAEVLAVLIELVKAVQSAGGGPAPDLSSLGLGYDELLLHVESARFSEYSLFDAFSSCDDKFGGGTPSYAVWRTHQAAERAIRNQIRTAYGEPADDASKEDGRAPYEWELPMRD